MTPEQKQLVIDYQTACDTDSGRRMYDDLMKWSGYNDRIIPNGEMTGFELGRRDMFLHIKDKIDTDLNKEVQTQAESEVEDENL